MMARSDRNVILKSVRKQLYHNNTSKNPPPWLNKVWSSVWLISLKHRRDKTVFWSQVTITIACEDHFRLVLFFQALLSSVKYVPVLPAWKTVKRMKRKRIVEGALIGVLNCLSSIKFWQWKENLSQKAVPLMLPVMLVKHWSYAKKLKGQHANGIAAIQMAAMAVQCLWSAPPLAVQCLWQPPPIAVQCLWSAPSCWLHAPWFPRCSISEGKRRLN